MFIIDKDGKIIEGIELTTEEVSILKALTTGAICAVSSSYVATRDEMKIARYLIENFHLSRRVTDAALFGDEEQNNADDLEVAIPVPAYTSPSWREGALAISATDPLV